MEEAGVSRQHSKAILSSVIASRDENVNGIEMEITNRNVLKTEATTIQQINYWFTGNCFFLIMDQQK